MPTPVATAAEAAEVARLILDPARDRPLVVLSSRFADPGHPLAFPLDAERVLEEAGDVAELVLLPTGDLSREIEQLLPPRTQVYGGAGRSYPVGFAVDPDWRRSPLRFPADNPDRATELLITDALGQAHAAGLFEGPSARSRQVSGIVTGFIAGDTRAIVRLDDGSLATVVAELTYPPTPLDWTLSREQRLLATLDENTRRLTIAGRAPTTEEVAVAFPHCSVTLALVEHVSSERARLALHPRLSLEVDRADVSPNPLDTLDLLLTEGEVVRVRVVHVAGEALHLRLSDVDDDEAVLPPLALVEGGPSWLVEGRSLPGAAALETGLTDAALAGITELTDAATRDLADLTDAATRDLELATPMPTVPPTATPTPSPTTSPTTSTHDTTSPGLAAESAAPASAPTSAPARPMPGPGVRRVTDDAKPRTPEPVEPNTLTAPRAGAVAAGGALQHTQLALEHAKARIAELEQRILDTRVSDSHVARLRETARRHEQISRDVRADLGEALAEIAALKARAAKSTRALRAARTQPPPPSSSRAADRRASWPDDESWIRHEILLAWVDRVSAAEKMTLTLPAYAIGHDFATSALALDSSQFRKAMKTVVDVLTGRAERMPKRDAHRLRTADSGGSPYVTRPDGAYCMRVAVEQNTPAARRLHYWVLPGGAVELGRVVTHDVTEA